MTCREKLAMEYPDKIDPASAGGCVGCPGDYGYSSISATDCGGGCTECWDREIPGLHKITPEFDIHALIDRCMEKRDRYVSIFFTEHGTNVHIYPYSEGESCE